MDFMNFMELLGKTSQTHGKVQTPGKRGKNGIPPTRPIAIHKVSMMSMVWNISIGRLGLAAWLCSLPAPACLLISQTQEIGERSLIS